MKPLSFFKGLSWLIFLNIVIKPVWIFAIDRQVQNTVGFAAYGGYFAVLNLSIVCSFVADAGLTNMVNRQMAMEGGKTTVSFQQLLGLKLALLMLYAGVVFAIGWLAHLSDWVLLVQVVAIQALTSLFLFFRNIITAHQLFTVDAWLSVVDKVLMIVVCGAFIYRPLLFGKIDLPIYLNAQISCTAIAAGVAVVILWRKQLWGRGEKSHIGAGMVAAVLPFTLILLLMSAHNRLDGFLVKQLHPNGAYEAGIYASAYRLLDAGNMLGYLAASFLVPFIARHMGNRLLLQTTLLQLRHALLLCGLMAVAFVWVFAGVIEQRLYHTGSPYNAQVLRLCIAVLPAYYMVHIYGSLLTAMGQFRTFIWLLLFSAAINTTMNVLLIPAYGALACCMAALVSQYSLGVLAYIAGSKQNKMALNAITWLWYLVAAAVSLLLFYEIRGRMF